MVRVSEAAEHLLRLQTARVRLTGLIMRVRRDPGVVQGWRGRWLRLRILFAHLALRRAIRTCRLNDAAPPARNDSGGGQPGG